MNSPHSQFQFSGQVPHQQSMGPSQHPVSTPFPKERFQEMPHSMHEGDPYAPQLARWTLKKGKHASWRDVRPQKQPISNESLEQELHRQKKGASITRTYNEITSDNARETVDTLVQDLNQELATYNPYMEWNIAGIELHWKSINRKLRQLERIDLVLKTEPRPRRRTHSVNVNNMRPAHSPHDSMHLPINHGRRQESQLPPQAFVQAPPPPIQTVPAGSHQNPHSNHAQNQPFNQSHGGHMNPPPPPQAKLQNHNMMHASMQGSMHGSMQDIPNMAPPPPPPAPTMQPSMGAQLSGRGPPPPPPPEHIDQRPPSKQQAPHRSQLPPLPKHLQQYLDQPQQPSMQHLPNMQNHDQRPPPPRPQQHQQKQHPVQQGQAGAHKGTKQKMPQSPVDVHDPYLLQSQKAKTKTMPVQYFPESDDDSETDSDSSHDSFSAESIEDDVLNLVRGRSHSQGRSTRKGRDHSQLRSQSRGRVTKNHKEKKPHGRGRSEISPPPIGVYSGRVSKHNSPKSSNDSFSPQLNHFPISSHGRASQFHSAKSSIDSLPSRNSPISRLSSSVLPQQQVPLPTSANGSLPPQAFTFHINTGPTSSSDNNKQPRRGRDSSRTGDSESDTRSPQDHRHRNDRERNPIRSNYARSPPVSPRQLPTYPMSRTSSGDRYSSTDSYVDSFSSVHSLADDSVFDEPIHHRVRNATQGSGVDGSYDEHSRSKYRGYRGSNESLESRERVSQTFDRRPTRQPVNDYPSLPRNSSSRNKTHPVVHSFDTAPGGRHTDSVASWPPRARDADRHTPTQTSNPFDPRYPARRSLSYSDAPQHPTYRHVPTANLVPSPTTSQNAFDMHKIFEAGVEALREKNNHGYESVRQPLQRQPLRRINTDSGRSASRPVDAWANPSYPVTKQGHHAGLKKAWCEDGSMVYV